MEEKNYELLEYKLKQLEEKQKILEEKQEVLEKELTETREDVRNVNLLLLELKANLKDLNIEIKTLNIEVAKLSSNKVSEDITKSIVNTNNNLVNGVVSHSSKTLDKVLLMLVVIIASVLGVNLDKIIMYLFK